MPRKQAKAENTNDNAALQALAGVDLSQPVNVKRKYITELGTYKIQFKEPKCVPNTDSGTGFVFDFDIVESSNDAVPVGTGCTTGWWTGTKFWANYYRKFIKAVLNAGDDELGNDAFLAEMVGEGSPIEGGICSLIVSEGANPKYPELQWGLIEEDEE